MAEAIGNKKSPESRASIASPRRLCLGRCHKRADCKLEFEARQAHRRLKTFIFSRFAIDGRSYSEAQLKNGEASGPAASIGRREWDRTTDPHHVKVVLYH